MKESIRIIIADDNIGFCDVLGKYLKQFEDIEILGIANTDDEEIKLIENLRPDIVISDLVRNHKYTGLDIIKEFNNKRESPKFLVISADCQTNFANDGVIFDGFIQKPCWNFEEIIKELRRIKKNFTVPNRL